MKKSIFIVVAILMMTLSLGLVACDQPSTDGDADTPRYVLEEGITLSNDVDYTTVKLDDVTYPALSDQGLFIVTGYDENDFSVVNEVPADNEDNIRNYFSPNKPTLIIIHGLQLGVGRNGAVYMTTENREEEVASTIYNKYVSTGEVDYLKNEMYNKEHDLTKYWFDGAEGGQAYNVFYFHYERFADTLNGTGIGAASAPTTVVDRIWSRDNGVQAMYLDSESGEYVYTEKDKAIGGYSVAEMFVGEYLRAFNHVDNLYPEYKTSQHHIRTASHSMGGVMAVASNILLKQVAEKGVISDSLTPSRLVQMDSYISMPVNNKTDKVAWSGKNYIELIDENGFVKDGEHSAIENYLCAIEGLAFRYNMAIDFYMNTAWIVPFMSMTAWDEEVGKWVQTGPFDMANTANRIMAVSTIVIVEPYFAGVGAGVTTAGHNPVREWILSSYLYDAPVVTVDGVTHTVPTANMSNEDVIALRGTLYAMVKRNSDGSHPLDGESADNSYNNETVRCDDDKFVKLA